MSVIVAWKVGIKDFGAFPLVKTDFGRDVSRLERSLTLCSFPCLCCTRQNGENKRDRSTRYGGWDIEGSWDSGDKSSEHSGQQIIYMTNKTQNKNVVFKCKFKLKLTIETKKLGSYFVRQSCPGTVVVWILPTCLTGDDTRDARSSCCC